MVTSESTLRSEPDYTFDFCGGQLAIDFTNTVRSRGGAPEEHLRTFGDLVAWAEARGILPRAGAARLRREAAGRPAAARAALGRALELREALYRVIEAAAATGRPAPADLAIVNAQVRETFSRMRLSGRRTRSVSENCEHAPRLELTTEDAGTEYVADPILTPVRSEERRVGKSVRCCVDLGGRRIIKKKKGVEEGEAVLIVELELVDPVDLVF